jgi:hypothetical protein
VHAVKIREARTPSRSFCPINHLQRSFCYEEKVSSCLAHFFAANGSSGQYRVPASTIT